MKQRKFEIHDFYCPDCNFKYSLPRSKGKLKEKGHLKKLYCLICQEEKNFIECNNKSYFFKDFEEEYKN